MAWHNNKQVRQTFASNNSENAWANIDTLGWRKIKPGNPDGVTNMYTLFNAAKGNNRTVNVNLDSSNQITIAYMN